MCEDMDGEDGDGGGWLDLFCLVVSVVLGMEAWLHCVSTHCLLVGSG
jgi:hypothetical protein